jgi:hypothetical protein
MNFEFYELTEQRLAEPIEQQFVVLLKQPAEPSQVFFVCGQ